MHLWDNWEATNMPFPIFFKNLFNWPQRHWGVFPRCQERECWTRLPFPFRSVKLQNNSITLTSLGLKFWIMLFRTWKVVTFCLYVSTVPEIIWDNWYTKPGGGTAGPSAELLHLPVVQLCCIHSHWCCCDATIRFQHLMGTDLNSNHTISLYMGLYNLRNKIKYTPKVGTMQGQLML